jgi:ATP-dependent DNA helicase RecG
MSIEELDNLLSADKETEHLEFKEVSGNFSILGKDDSKGGIKQVKSLYGYCVAIGNEGGGKIIFGVKDKINPTTKKRDIIGTNAIQNKQKTKEQIYKVLKRRIEIEELQTTGGKVQIVKVPSHPVGEPFDFYGVYLMRNGENLEKMDAGTLSKIINEARPDFSSLINDEAVWDDLDPAAIEALKNKWIIKSGNKDLIKCNHQEILEKLLLVRNGKITNAALLLACKEASLAKLIPNSEIFLEWRLDSGKMDYDLREPIRKPYILAAEEIWNFVNSRNTRTPFRQGFFEMDIWAYDELSVREAIANAFAHREYRNRTEPIYMRVSPEKITVKSPGGFVPGVTLDNIFEIEGKWRNPLLMEVLGKVGVVERAGFGLDRIYKTAISEGKGSPDFNGTNDEYVILNLPTIVKDINFVYFLQKIENERQIKIDATKDFIELEKIRESGKTDNIERLNFFFKNGIVEKVGHGRGQKHILAKQFYDFIDKKGEYTRKKWLSKTQQKEVMVNFFRQHKKGKMSDFVGLFEDKLNSNQIFILLDELRSDGLIFFDGKRRSPKGLWKIVKE